MPANPPTRATLKVTISLGLVSIPCALFASCEESNVSRSMFIRGTDHRVGQKKYDKLTGADVSDDQIVKRMETEDGWVEISDEEMTQAGGESEGSCDIVGFLPVEQLTDGTYSLENYSQIRPAPRENGKPNPAANKAFALLTEVMGRKKVFALVSYTARGAKRFAAFTADGSFTTLRFDEEVRAPRPLPIADLSEAELNMGEMLVNSYVLDEAPVLVDLHNNAIREYAASKAKAISEGKAPPEIEVVQPASEAPNDLLAALAATVAAGRS